MPPTNDDGGSFEALMADVRLVELCTLQRTGDDLLDVVSLTENQHSDLLAWLLDAREGHGQGDEILRDLLVHAADIVHRGAGQLDPLSKTSRTLRAWPPSRVRTSSFGSAFVARELGTSARDRVDLFVIDPHNKLILVVENKSGARHTDQQLGKYRREFESHLRTHRHLKDFDPAYLALDRAFDREGEGAASRPDECHWLHLDYGWLKASAERARVQVVRGNSAARLVMSYCNRQTAWVGSGADRCKQLAVGLYRDYRGAMGELMRLSNGRPERRWLRESGHRQEMLFVLQNKSAMAVLREAGGMAAVRAALLDEVEGLCAGHIRTARVRLDVCLPGCEHWGGPDGAPPVYVEIRSMDGDFRYRAWLVLDTARLLSRQERDVRAVLAAHWSKFGRVGKSVRVTVELGVSLSLQEVVAEVGRAAASVAGALSSSPGASSQPASCASAPDSSRGPFLMVAT